jgi:MFS family permease
VITPTTPYADVVIPFILCGVGMTLFFVPLASLVLGAVPRTLEGIASGANAAFRELGGVLGIAVLGAVFSSHGSYGSGQDYVHGMTAAVYAGAAVVAVGVVAALMVPGRRRQRAATVDPEELLVSRGTSGDESGRPGSEVDVASGRPLCEAAASR